MFSKGGDSTTRAIHERDTHASQTNLESATQSAAPGSLADAPRQPKTDVLTPEAG